MYEVFLSFLAGLIVGFVFMAIRLPIPAPPVLPGVMGIVGIYTGSLVYSWVIQRFF